MPVMVVRTKPHRISHSPTSEERLHGCASPFAASTYLLRAILSIRLKKMSAVSVRVMKSIMYPSRWMLAVKKEMDGADDAHALQPSVQSTTLQPMMAPSAK